ncbi:MAG: hypothetical protein JW739_05640 [Opitutales bacterium]|nr:hypothetical protein [Opitutales bacterium]
MSMRGLIKVDIHSCIPGKDGNPDELGPIIKPGDWQGNMILNCGLDLAMTNLFADCFKYGHLSTDTAAPVATDTSMAGWVKQHTSYGAGDGLTEFSGDVYSLQRSFVFSAETGDQIYRKFFSTAASGSAATPFNEILFTNPIVLSADQMAKVTMRLDITITPHMTAQTLTGDVISGVSGSSGKLRIISFATVKGSYGSTICSAFMLSAIKPDGNIGIYRSTSSVSDMISNGYYCPIFEPSNATEGTYATQTLCVYQHWISLSDPVDSLSTTPGVNNSDIGTTSSVSLSSYVPGSYQRTKSFFADLNYCNVTGIKSIGLYNRANDGYYPVFQFLLDNTFTKTNVQQLTFNLNFTLGRG